MACAWNIAAFFGLVALVAVQGERVTERQTEAQHANPIRRVVTMLQMMQKKIAAEGEKEADLYEKFMCYCKNGGGQLEKAVAESGCTIPDLQSEIEELIAKIAQLKASVAKAEKDRQAAKDAIAEATATRTKEHKKFLDDKASNDAQMAMIKKLIAAIQAMEKGAYGKSTTEFLQQKVGVAAMDGVKTLLLSDGLSLSDYDRESVASFLSQGSGGQSGYTPQSGEIIGMLKQMLDVMRAHKEDTTATESGCDTTFKGICTAKLAEIDALTKQIEGWLKLIGELQVKLVYLKDSLTDEEAALLDNTKFLADLGKICAAKKAEYELRVKTRGEELLAIAETIKMLNDDDSLDLFKKTLPSSSFVQVAVRESALRQRALALVQQARTTVTGPGRANLGFLVLALSGKKVNFAKVIKMIDNMVALLKDEQLGDDSKKEYCGVTIDRTEDSKKELDHDITDLSAAIADMTSAIATLAEEIEALKAGIVALDKSVAEATVQRKEENEDYTELMASDTAALELLEMAKNRLNKFYNPRLYKPPPTTPAPNADWAHLELGQQGATPVVMEPPPETWGAYSKKGEESNSVISMIDDLKKELEVELTEATTEEKNAQEEYEDMMKDSAEKRLSDTKAIAQKTEETAMIQGDLVEAEAKKVDKVKELMATEKFLGTLHLECDWLLKNYALRAEARAGEVESLLKAKAVLSGADYSFVQTSAMTKLRR